MRWAALALLLLACDEDAVTIRASDDTVALRVSLIGRAETAAERMEGLRGRDLRPGEGLLITFPVEDELCITNAGVTLPIDAVFIDQGGVVTNVERAVPGEDATLRCARGQWILEVLAFEADAVEPSMVVTGL